MGVKSDAGGADTELGLSAYAPDAAAISAFSRSSTCFRSAALAATSGSAARPAPALAVGDMAVDEFSFGVFGIVTVVTLDVAVERGVGGSAGGAGLAAGVPGVDARAATSGEPGGGLGGPTGVTEGEPGAATAGRAVGEVVDGAPAGVAILNLSHRIATHESG